MKKVAIFGTQKAIIPEIDIYQRYLNKQGIACDVFREYIDIKAIQKQYGVLWYFGFPKNRISFDNKLIIHEYQSGSTPPFPKLKDWIKKKVILKPNIRIFQNNKIKYFYNFQDKVPYLLRPMGFDAYASNVALESTADKKYDFIYVGVIDKKRNTLNPIMKLAHLLPHMSFLLIGPCEENFIYQIKRYKNIHYRAHVPNNEIYNYYAESSYGLNIVPNWRPYSSQDSTKLIEYMSMGLKIITIDNPIAKEVETKFASKFYFLPKNINIDTINTLLSFKYKTDYPATLEWEKIMEKIFQKDLLLNLILENIN